MSTKTAIPTHPRIAMIGAGVLGTVYGAKLAKAGHAVTVVERAPARAESIRSNGLTIEKLDGTGRETFPVTVIDKLDSGADFDLAIVIARKTHLPGILEMLAPTAIPSVLFMMSNADGPAEILAALGDRAVLGFPGAGGRVVDGVVQYSIPPAAMQSTMLGEIDGVVSDRITSLKTLITSGGFNVAIAKNMDAWLKSHEAFVASTGNATYIAGTGAAIVKDRALLTLNIRAIREIYNAMDVAELKVEPAWFRLWQRLPLPVIRATYGGFVGSKAWDDLGTDQLHSMRDEVEAITDELLAFARENGTPTPALTELADRRRALTPAG